MSAPPPVTLLQLSDLHLTAERGPADRALAAALAAIRAASDVERTAIVVTGDLSDDGSRASYRRVEAALAPLRDSRSGVIVLPGNHDDVAVLRDELLLDGPVDRVVPLDGVRIVCLDSTVPGAHHGELEVGQLTWLSRVLREPYPGGTVLVLHHPPLAFDDPVLDRLALRAPEGLAAAIAGSDVRLVLCGHAHLLTAGALGGTPVWCAPALAMHTDALPPAGRARSVDGHGGLTRVALRGAATTAAFVPVVDGPVLRYDESRTERVALLHRLEAEAVR